MSTVRILVVDDEARVRGAIVRCLREVSGFEVAGEADSGAEALEKFASLSPDIVVLDISMPVINGLEVARRMLKTNSKIKIILVSSLWTRQHEVEARQIGAFGFVPKDKIVSDLAERIRQAAEHS